MSFRSCQKKPSKNPFPARSCWINRDIHGACRTRAVAYNLNIICALDRFGGLMFRMLIDTCVWFDLAKDQRQISVLGVIEEMVKRGLISLIVPRIVFDEFRSNRERIAKESAKSLSAHFRLVKDAVGKIGGDKRRMRLVLSHLHDVDHKNPIVGGT